MIHNNREKTGKRAAWISAFIAAAMLTACSMPSSGDGSADPSPSPTRYDTGFEVTGPDSFDSADTAVLADWNTEENTLTFLNPDLGKRYTLSVDGTTRLYDKYGDAIALGQLQKGDIVDVTFLKSKKHLTTLQLCPRAWVYDNAERYEFDTLRSEVTVGSEVFKLTSNTLFFSEGRNIESMDLNPADVLTFCGIDSQVLAIRVDKGHGYLRLENDEKFLGGWIEIGQAVIQRITEDMLVPVPEGSYQVTVSNKGGGGTKSVLIRRNEETVLDIGDLEIPEPLYGMVLFALNPSNAELYIDGDLTDPSGPVSLEYGLHQLIARAQGYKTVTQYIRVAQESVGINVELDAMETPSSDKSDDKSDDKTDDETTSSGEAREGYYKVYIDAPEGVEVYLDGNYIGISPCSFAKTEGTHIITLRKTGYTTRSYTIEVNSEEKDISYSFDDLAAASSPLDSSVSDMWNSLLDSASN